MLKGLISLLIACVAFPAFASEELKLPLLECQVILTSKTYALKPEETRDVSVELEMDFDFDLLAVLTTHDGTVAPVLGHLAPPKWLKTQVWDELTPVEKMNLLRYVSKPRVKLFAEDRRIPGLRPRSEIKLYFSKETMFLGQIYSSGEHVVDLSAVLEPYVEYRSPKDIRKVSGVELHFRRKGLASDVSEDAETFQKGLELPVTHQHVHIVEKIPVDAFFHEPVSESYALADYMRRVNLVAEMQAIDEGYPIAVRTSFGEDGLEYFEYDSFEISDYNSIISFVMALGRNSYENYLSQKRPERQNSCVTSKCAVALRSPHKYDEEKLFGIEARFVDLKTPRKLRRRLLDAIQFSLHTGHYGVNERFFVAWVMDGLQDLKVPSVVLSKFIQNRFNNAHYNTKIETLLAKVPKETGQLIQFWTEFKRLAEDHLELKMLLFRWEQDLILYGREDLLPFIEREQLSSLRAIRNGASVNETVRQFLRKTGIRKLAFASIGIGTAPKRKQTAREILLRDGASE